MLVANRPPRRPPERPGQTQLPGARATAADAERASAPRAMVEAESAQDPLERAGAIISWCVQPRTAAQRLQGRTGGRAAAVACGTGRRLLVGGTIRDLLRGRDPVELDLVVEGRGPIVLALGRPGAPRQFGTATVTLGDCAMTWLAHSRRPTPGREPCRSGARRDRAGSAPPGLHGQRGRVAFRAATGRPAVGAEALEDLTRGGCGCCTDAAFSDDPTRLLRMVRYETRLGFGGRSGHVRVGQRGRVDRARCGRSARP